MAKCFMVLRWNLCKEAASRRYFGQHPVVQTAVVRLKRKLYDQLTEAYGRRKRCLRVVDIDRLPSEAVLVLHGSSDPISSPFRNAFLVLNIERPPMLQPGTTHRDIETHLRRYLHSLWDTELGLDEVYALISRLTRQIGVFDV